MSDSNQILTVNPSGALRGSLQMPGDKSMSHRALILGAMAEGRTRVTGILEADDILSTRKCLEAMGVEISGPEQGSVGIEGVGLEGFRQPAQALDCGNSGTTMRLLAGLLAGQPFRSTLTGDDMLSRRPMERIIEPLTAMGARVTGTGGHAPLTIEGKRPLTALLHVSPVASAQVKSCILLAGLQAEGHTEVSEPGPSRNHTEHMLEAFGCPVELLGNRVAVEGVARLRATEIYIPGDPSSAAFFAVAASLIPGSDLTLENVGVNPTRSAFVEILRQMGADISVESERKVNGEPVADLRIRHSELRGVDVDPYLVPAAIDEFPVLFVAAAGAVGTSSFTGVSELRVKESDRISVMARALAALGVQVEEEPEGLRIEGGKIQGGRVDAVGDHRCAMSLAVAGLLAAKPVSIAGAGNIRTSFPRFMETLAGLTRR